MPDAPPTPAEPALPPLQVADVERAVARELDRMSPVLDELGERFAAAGEQLHLVGGPVRDAMLGRPNSDLDLTTSARPETTERLVRGWADAVWDIGRAFGTIGCRKGEWQVEITTYRSEAYDPSSRKPTVDFGDTLAGDLGRRDFTVNAMAVSLPGREFEDPHGGLLDLAHRVLRTPGAPEDSFGDDPLRMMRAARFAAQLGFSVDPGVVAAMTAMADRIEIISAERVRDELVKLVCAPHPRLGLTLLVTTGLADRVLPELPALALERDEHHRHKDVYEHTLTVLEQSIDLEHRLAGEGEAAARLRLPVRGAHARRRQAADPEVPARRLGDLPPPRRGRRQADAQADEGAALLQRRGRGGLASWSSSTCGSTATAPGSGPTRPCAATSATPATS